MKKTWEQPQKKLFQQRLPKSIYNPAKQFKHRDRGIHDGRTNTQ